MTGERRFFVQISHFGNARIVFDNFSRIINIEVGGQIILQDRILPSSRLSTIMFVGHTVHKNLFSVHTDN